MTSRGHRRAPGRHIAPKSRSRFLAPVAIGTAVVLGGSAATGATNLVQTPANAPVTVTATKATSKSATKSNAVSTKKTVKTTTKKTVKPPTVKTGTRTETKVSSVRFDSTTVHDASLVKGTKVLRKSGVPGKVRLTYRVKYLQGKVVAKVLVGKKVLSKPRSAVYIVGTGKPTVVEASLQAAAKKTGTPNGNKVFAQAYIQKTHGWSAGEFSCLTSLWNRESHWRHTARNRGSGAYGIPQAMPGSKMAKFGADWQTNPVTQIKWGVNYIAKRYKTPCNALAHSHATGWY